MALFTFWTSDVIPEMEQITGSAAQKIFDINLLSDLMRISHEAIERRFEKGNEAWVLSIENTPVSFGWIGRGLINIGELSKEQLIPAGNAYFWNFRTVESHRGKGFYPYLLRAMIKSELRVSDRLWIIAAPENKSSFKGIVKSGFTPVGVLGYHVDNMIGLLPFKNTIRATVASEVFQVPLADSAIKPCWSCYSNTMKTNAAGCQCKDLGFVCSCSKNK